MMIDESLPPCPEWSAGRGGWGTQRERCVGSHSCPALCRLMAGRPPAEKVGGVMMIKMMIVVVVVKGLLMMYMNKGASLWLFAFS